MKIYTVTTKDGESKTFYDLPSAKKYMKANEGSRGDITKVWSNGDWEPCGEIKLAGRNSVKMSNEKSPNYR